MPERVFARHALYASGTVGTRGGRTVGALRIQRRLPAGRYTLTLLRGRRVVGRRTVLAG